VFASGVDNKLVQFKRLRTGTGKRRWVFSGRARDHTHDVRTIALGPSGELVTGGVDTNLIVYSAIEFGDAKARHRKIPPFPQHPFIGLAKGAGLLAANRLRKIQVWKLAPIEGGADLGSYVGGGAAAATTTGGVEAAADDDGDDDDGEGAQQEEVVSLATLAPRATAPPQLVLELEPFSLDNVACCAISDDGRYLAYSCVSGTRLFKLDFSGGGGGAGGGRGEGAANATVTRIKGRARELLPAHVLTFTADSSKLVLATADRTMQVFDVLDGDLLTSETPGGDGESEIPGSCMLAVSSDGSVAALSNDRAIRIFDVVRAYYSHLAHFWPKWVRVKRHVPSATCCHLCLCNLFSCVAVSVAAATFAWHPLAPVLVVQRAWCHVLAVQRAWRQRRADASF
jgi:WD40 repeat protein